MSLGFCIPIVECVYCLVCARWVWKRCLHTGGHDSENWGLASFEEFEPVPRLCRLIISIYRQKFVNSVCVPPVEYCSHPEWVIKHKTYEDTKGRAPPYLIYLDHDNAEIVLAIRGLNLVRGSDYAVLLDNRLGKRNFDGGYVHNGLLKSSIWIFDQEREVLRELLEKNPSYKLILTGHSLGAGVAALLAMVVLQNRSRLVNIVRKRIKCFAIAPTRCMSLNLAIKYADVINSVVLQDDFLPRTTSPLEDIFKSLFCLPCILCLRCMIDTCIPEQVMLRDPRRLYAPGRIYHIVERKPFRCKRFPPVVRTAIPVDGRFEHIILSCNATKDHAIAWIEREARRALDLMMEKEKPMEIPANQRMERHESLIREHGEECNAALQRAKSLSVPHALSPSTYGTFEANDEEIFVKVEASVDFSVKSKQGEIWDKLIKCVFHHDEPGYMVLTNSPFSGGFNFL